MASIFYKNIMYGGGGGSGTAYGGTEAPSASIGSNGDYYYQYSETTGDVGIVYVKLSNTWHKIDGGDIVIDGSLKSRISAPFLSNKMNIVSINATGTNIVHV